ncbi:MAG: transcription elongation factor GreA [candidate division Zixibacteria bacterium]|nr:transcription elongation factor GreA [candidate division Zixibacteria bacterium]MDH3937178.1 transcription elongation factor GreA [candidate division Zixibacteria bacterium]MDH4033804.1 transcription elongation factor GreA [candidate division Zixibacteria bacterium]
MSESIKMSRAALVKLEAELKRLKFEERPKIVAEIKRTMELGDLSENAEYHAAKETQRHLEAKLADLEYSLSRVELIDTDAIPSDKVYLYAKVLVKDLSDGEEIEYTIVPAEEADVDNDIISVKSPVASAMLGKAVGDKVDIKVPVGTISYEILKISRD